MAYLYSLQWHYNEHDGVSHHRHLDCLITHLFVQAQIKENIKALHHWSLRGESTSDWWIPPQRASNMENVSIW